MTNTGAHDTPERFESGGQANEGSLVASSAWLAARSDAREAGCGPRGSARPSGPVRGTGNLRARDHRVGGRMKARVRPPGDRPVRIGTQRLRARNIGGAPGAAAYLLLFNGIGASVETLADFIADAFSHTLRHRLRCRRASARRPRPGRPTGRAGVARSRGGDLLTHLGLQRCRCVRRLVGRRGGAGVRAAAHPTPLQHADAGRHDCAGFVMVPGRLNRAAEAARVLRRYLDPGLPDADRWRVLYGGELRLRPASCRSCTRLQCAVPSRRGYSLPAAGHRVDGPAGTWLKRVQAAGAGDDGQPTIRSCRWSMDGSSRPRVP